MNTIIPSVVFEFRAKDAEDAKEGSLFGGLARFAVFGFIGLFALAGTVQAAPAASHAPVVRDGMVIRTVQQDAELKDWIVGLQGENQRNGELAAQVAAAEATVRASLKDADIRADALQVQVCALQSERDDAVAEDKKLTLENGRLKTILGIEAAVLALLACLWLRVPSLSPPWGLVATIAAPVIVFGIVKLIL